MPLELPPAESLHGTESLFVDTPIHHRELLDAADLANRELLRPRHHNHGQQNLEPFSVAWFDELERKRYERHGSWLPGALEFGRHPGESILLLGPGLGSDAIRYTLLGSEVYLAITPADHPDLIRRNHARHGLTPRIVGFDGAALPFSTGLFDVVVFNALHQYLNLEAIVAELNRVLKAGGKLIGLFPARYDVAFWQNVLLPLERMIWHRPPDPMTAPKYSRRELCRTFACFNDHRVYKRHLRRSELPYLWRVLPRPVLERFIGRVMILKAFKPLPVIRSSIGNPYSAVAA